MAGPTVKIKRLAASVRPPAYQSAAAAGMDLCAAPDEAISLAPGERRAIGTGLAVQIPPGYEGQVRPRSGWALEYGLTLLNAPGTIDADYRGEVRVILINLGKETVTIAPGDRIAQLVIAPVARAELIEVDELDRTARGTGGFGHSGR